MNGPVATATSKAGGNCDECGIAIGAGHKIYKYATEGSTTGFGNGPGIWVCNWCHRRRGDRRFECVHCMAMTDIVVEVAGAPWCVDCYVSLSSKSGRLM